MRCPRFRHASLAVLLASICLAAIPQSAQAQHGAPKGNAGAPAGKGKAKKTVSQVGNVSATGQPLAPPAPAVTPPPADVTPPDPQSLVAKLSAASTQGRTAIQSTDTAFQTADTLQKTLTNFATPKTASSMASRIAALSGLVSQLGQVTEAQDAVKKAQAKDADLGTADVALTTATGDKDVKASTDSKVAQALKDAQATQGDVEARLKQLKALCDDKGAGSLPSAVTSVAAALSSLSSDLTASVAKNPINNKAFASSTDSAAIRQTLAQGMDSLAQSFTDEHAFLAAYGGLKDALKSAGAPDKTLAALDNSQQNFEKAHAAPSAVAEWFQFLTGAKAGDDLKDLDAKHTQIARDIQAGSTHTDAVLAAPATLADAQAEGVQLTAIVNAWPPLVAAWENYDPTVTGALGGASRVLSTQTLTLTAISNVAADIDDLLTGNQTKFVTQQINLFYFTDVQRLMKALNARTQQVNEGQGDEQTKADQARKDLLDAEGETAKSITRVNEAKSQLRTIQEDIRQANANAADAANQAATAHVLYNHLLDQQTKLKAQLQSTAGDPALKDVATPLDAQVKSALTAQTAADTNNASAQQAVSGLQIQAAALPQKLLNAQDTLSAARATLDEQRTIASRRAEEEVQAFANARDNAPYLFAPARFLSTDPSQRVKLYGYPDSKTIIVQGLPKDVQDVEDVIAEFDRPSPQARVTLWSLQFNGSDNASLSEVVQNVNQHLLLTRTLIGLVQDRLRDSLGFVVNQVAANAVPELDFLPDDDSRGRLLRYQFYQPEVLTRLGYDLQLAPAPISQAQFRFQQDLNNLNLHLAEHTPDIHVLNNDVRLLKADQTSFSQLLTNSTPALPALQSAAENLSNVVGHAVSPVSDLQRRDLQEQATAMQQALTALLTVLTTASPTPPSALPPDELAADDAFVTRFTLPDPAHATTLGEMLFVLSLGRQQYREAVISHFLLSLESIPENLPGFRRDDPTMSGQRDRLKSFTKGLTASVIGNIALAAKLEPTELLRELQTQEGIDSILEAEGVKQLATDMLFSSDRMKTLIMEIAPASGKLTGNAIQYSEETESDRFYPRFPSAILGSFPDFGTDPLPNNYPAMTANQNEILLAIQAQGRDSVANEVNNLLRQIDDLKTSRRRNGDLGHQLRMQYLPLVGWLYTKFYQPGTEATRQPVSWLQRGLVAVGAMDKGTLMSPSDLSHLETNLTTCERTKALAMDQQAWQIASLAGQHNSLGRATPRVAAADDMIKRLIITVEDDLDYFFVQPELEAIRKEAVRPGVEFGSIQREGLLVTNRRVGRVDPRANADPELSGGTDFLAEASQLGQLYDRFRQEQGADKIVSSGATAAGGLASLLGSPFGTASGIGAVASLVGDMLTTPQPVGEIYSINSGNLFKITPIFDPSGQALRFQFDYTGVIDVREPDGTTNPSIPRVERHTVDDDVQLTNLELREVSRFESNNALGTPERRTGGLPLLKELPILKDIPIIGYYTRTAKKAAVRQESLIFAQTSMYPTVSDIVNLLVDIPPLGVTPRSIPDYLDSEKNVGKTAPAVQAAPYVHRTVTPTAVVRVDALNVRFSPARAPMPIAGLRPLPVASRNVRWIHVPTAPPLPATPVRSRLKPVGGPGIPLPRRDPAKQAAAVSDFILPAGMAPH